MTEYLELFDYEAETGRLLWRVSRSSRAKVGAEAGGLHRSGYVRLTVDGREVMAHRVIWEMHYGAIPDGSEIDHINGVRDDNRLSNLRAVSRAINAQNKHRGRRGSSSGALGVVKRAGQRRQFEAWITTGGVQKYLGCFASAEEASAAYVAAKRIDHPESSLARRAA